jgi:hypothetical protein
MPMPMENERHQGAGGPARSRSIFTLAKLFPARARKGDEELLTAIAAYEIVGADVLAEAAGDFFEHHRPPLLSAAL